MQRCSYTITKRFFATRVFNGYYDLSGPPWNQEMTFPWSKFGEILERSQDPPLAGPKTYLGFSEPSSIIPLAAIKQVRCIDHPNEYPQLLVATAKHSLSLAFSNEGERSKWVEAINWRPPLVNLTGSAADPAPPRNLSTVVQIGNHPVANGGFAWVYQGTWDDDGVIKNVAVKVIRKQDGTDLIKLNKRLRREVKVWNRLSHENILELYGVSYDHGPFASMICPWMEGGTLSAFITPETRINKRLKLLYDVGKALVYLHSEGVVHGDLTTANVLIDAHENAVLSDFGLSTILAQFSGTSYMSTSLARGGALRWADPALSHVGDDPAQPLTPPSPTLTSDIYSFGCVLYHVISGRIPFQDLDDLQVIFAVSARGERPPRPQKVEDPCWEFMEKCWAVQIPERPVASEVLAFIVSWRKQTIEIPDTWLQPN
ncbi:kinase-like domain-containing protein [Mycena sanguinolenta]|nr:kinase-like domain-containing protein [Mycena sanguinolenta]